MVESEGKRFIAVVVVVVEEVREDECGDSLLYTYTKGFTALSSLPDARKKCPTHHWE